MIPSAQICGAFSANTPGGAFQPRLPGTKSPEDVHNTMSGPGHFFPGTGFSEKDYNDLMVFSQPGLCFFQNCFQITEYILVAMGECPQTCGNKLRAAPLLRAPANHLVVCYRPTHSHPVPLQAHPALSQYSLQHCNIIQMINI